MPLLNHAADSPLRALDPCHPDRNSRLCRSVAERLEKVWRPAGWAHGGVLQRGAGLPVGVVPARCERRGLAVATGIQVDHGDSLGVR